MNRKSHFRRAFSHFLSLSDTYGLLWSATILALVLFIGSIWFVDSYKQYRVDAWEQQKRDEAVKYRKLFDSGNYQPVQVEQP